MKVTVEKVSNGYVVTTPDGVVHVATEISPYNYSSTGLSTVLNEIFSIKKLAEENAPVDAEVTT